ncbi:ATPase [Tyrophagus putrescentiae]|nr:ATPase [Tyrophagus putrescentiae]
MSFSSKSFVSASLGWYNINVSSKAEKTFFGMKPGRPATQIIKNVSGEVPSGSSLAIMGSSGAGKTTLLNVLTARNLSNFAVDGTVKINGQVADVNKITAMSAYVQQQDLFIATLTVREHLTFQALVRMDPTTSDVEKVQRVNEVMKELSLEKCADNLVGGTLATGKGISGGELKRLAFACEILTKPSILFCDEPTSGLDSFMAATLVGFLDRMATAGRTIICTIHQPASNVFSLFQNLLLMADGRVAYMGPTKAAPAFFASLKMECPPNYNPAEFYVKQLAVMPGKEVSCRKKLNAVCDHFASKTVMKDLPEKATTTFVSCESVVFNSPYKTSCFVQYQALAWRSYVCTMREPLLTYIRGGQALITACILALFFFHSKYDQRGSFNTNGALYLYLVNISLNNAFCVVNVFCSEMPIFLREHNSGMYRVDAYFVMRNVAETPIFIFIPVFYGLIIYYLIGLNPPFDACLYLIVVGIAISLVGVSYGYFISAVCNNTDLALAVGPPIFIPLQLLGGYYLNNKTIPKSLSWAQFLSWFYFGFDLLVNNQWTNVDMLDCVLPSMPNVTFSTLPPSVSNVTLPPNPSPASLSCFHNGEDVMQFLDMGHKGEVGDFFGLFFLFLVLRVVAYLALYLRAIFSR